MTATTPSEEYGQRLEARRARVRHFDRAHVRIGNLRLVVAIIGIALAWVSFGRHAIGWWWLSVPLAAFIALAFWDDAVLRHRKRAESAVAFYERGLARLRDEWTGRGEAGERFADPHHVYSGDLDLFGRGSLFELLSLSRTRMGEERLAEWLLNPAPLATVRERQQAVAELRDALDLREDLAMMGEYELAGVHPAELAQWAEAPADLTGQWRLVLAMVFAVLAVAGVVVWALWSVLPFLAVLAAESVFVYSMRKPLRHMEEASEHALEDLELFSAVLARVERERFESPRLAALHAELLANSQPASAAMVQLRRRVEALASRHNLFVRIFDVPLMYSVQLSFAIERWRARHGHDVRKWIDAIAEFEALLSLSAYSYERPQDIFPEFVQDGACFCAQELGHPLIPDAKCVRNSLDLCGATRVLLVSGSNMSGKSTLLRAVGLNTVLAMAGAPVRARSLRLSPLHVGASLRVADSLQEGASRFYAEIRRLRQIVDLAAQDTPLLFLIDEFLQGTNSRDRRIGADALLRELLERGAIGLVTTHDLALTEVAGDGAMRNVHFQDYLENDVMRFDYKLREGVVARSNGLELMRSIGLKV